MRRRVLASLLALPLLVAAAIWQADIKTDISAFFMSGGSSQAAVVAGDMQRGEISRRYLLSVGLAEHRSETGGESAEFAELLRGELSLIAGVSRVWGEGLGEDELRELIAFYLPYRYALHSLQPETHVAAMFSDSALAARAERVKQGLLSPEGQWVKQILVEDPMFFISDWFYRFSGSGGKQVGHAALVIETTASGLDTASQKPIHDRIEAAFARLNRDYGDGYTLAMTGVPMFAMAVQEHVQRDVMLVSTISSLAMLLLFLLLFRSFRALAAVLLTLVAAASVATIATSVVFTQIHALTLALGTTLIGICVDYPIHTMVHAAGGGASAQDSAQDSAKRIWPSLLLGAITTVVGYAALSFTGYPGMQQIALYAAVGILTSLLVSRFIIPYAIERHAALMVPRFRLNGWLRYAVAGKLRLPVIIASLLLLIAGLSNINWQDDLSRMAPSLEEMRETDRQVRSRMQSIEPGRFVLIHAGTPEQALQINEQAALALEQLKAAGKLDSYHSLFPWLASQALQERNVRLFSEQLNGESVARWHAAVTKAGLRSSLLPEPVIKDVPALDLAAVSNSPAGRYIAGQYVIEDKQTILTIWLGGHDAAAVQQALAGIDQAEYVSQKDMINEMNTAYRSKAIEALAYGALVILLLLALRYGSGLTALQALLPAMVSVAIVLGGWGVSGQPLGMLHLVGMLLAVAICVDYGIFFIENRARDMELTYQAIVASALTTMVAFSCLGLAENPALQTLAWTIAPGVFLGFFLCPLLVRSRDPVAGEKR